MCSNYLSLYISKSLSYDMKLRISITYALISYCLTKKATWCLLNSGSKRIVDVMDTDTETHQDMSMKEWVRYYENKERTANLNVTNLEFTNTKLETYVEQPEVVSPNSSIMVFYWFLLPTHLIQSNC